MSALFFYLKVQNERFYYSFSLPKESEKEWREAQSDYNTDLEPIIRDSSLINYRPLYSTCRVLSLHLFLFTIYSYLSIASLSLHSHSSLHFFFNSFAVFYYKKKLDFIFRFFCMSFMFSLIVWQEIHVSYTYCHQRVFQ